MAIYNYLEDLIQVKIQQILSNKNNVCKCDKCLSDMLAYAINGLPVISYVTSDGGIHREVQNLTNDNLKIELATRCVKAVDLVGKNPKHKK
ncbi:MAG TPA: late competence development ComFB family protein [Candidatus Wallbacteria bacterium]|nr:MAG: Late competence development protein ComFB [bacterium ADurb.Bin243]HPG58616.1 late competence development ComFB family protein [Candidatus Wallbacteria bacterium]